MKILITGALGQLGYELQRTAPTTHTLVCTDSADLDITKKDQLAAVLQAEQPDVIINAAAYTAVDKAESDKELAWKINHQGAENLAMFAQQRQIHLIQVSTDFVFDGKHHRPYLPTDTPSSNSVYGASKAAGEQAVLENAPNHSLIVRTSWLYSSHGNNFVKTMLKLMQEKNELGIIADQIGTPTWANTLATAIWHWTHNKTTGLLHCSDNGVASWYDFAVQIYKQGTEMRLINNQVHIKPIRTEDYPTPATRPAYSVMDKAASEQLLGYTLPHWTETLAHMLQELKHQ